MTRKIHLLDEAPPHDLAIEAEVLGALLVIDKQHKNIKLVAETEWCYGCLEQRDFYDELNAWIYGICRLAWKHDLAVSPAAWRSFLEQRIHSCPKGCRDLAFGRIGELFDTYVPSHLRYHAEQLRALRVRRGLRWLGEELLRRSLDLHDAGEVVEWAQTKLKQLEKLNSESS